MWVNSASWLVKARFQVLMGADSSWDITFGFTLC